jgi:hypothetical protein
MFDRDPLAWSRATPAACVQAMTPLALVRSGAHGVLEWLGRTVELVLQGPPPRGDPGEAAPRPA